MKIKDLIKVMSDDTEILIYTESRDCAMPYWGHCNRDEDDETEYDCKDCGQYIGYTWEYTKYHGTAKECPIKLADKKIKEVNNAYHEVQKTKRKKEKRQLIAVLIEEL